MKYGRLAFFLTVLWLIPVIRLSALEIDFALAHHKLGYPLLNNPIGSKWNPGFRIGAGFSYLEMDHFRLAGTGFFSASLGRESFYGNLFSFGTEVIPRYEFDFGVSAEGILGFSYMHSFSTLPVYTATAESVSPAADWGKPNLVLSLGAGIGYRLPKEWGIPLRIYLRYDFDLVYGFSFGLYDLAFLPASTLWIGAAFSL